jgi:hypothetical protein
MRWWMLVLAVGACGVEDELAALGDLVDDGPIPPPPTLSLAWQGDATRGGVLQLRATPNGSTSQVGFVVGTAASPGACPPALGGVCLDLGGSVRFLGARPVVAGAADKSWTVPLAAPDTVFVQAVQLVGGQVVKSDVEAVSVVAGVLQIGDQCTGAWSACDVGLSCCYPCGIPGCQHRCEATCDPADPACSGGCYLYP